MFWCGICLHNPVFGSRWNSRRWRKNIFEPGLDAQLEHFSSHLWRCEGKNTSSQCVWWGSPCGLWSYPQQSGLGVSCGKRHWGLTGRSAVDSRCWSLDLPIPRPAFLPVRPPPPPPPVRACTVSSHTIWSCLSCCTVFKLKSVQNTSSTHRWHRSTTAALIRSDEPIESPELCCSSLILTPPSQRIKAQPGSGFKFRAEVCPRDHSQG